MLPKVVQHLPCLLFCRPGPPPKKNNKHDDNQPMQGALSLAERQAKRAGVWDLVELQLGDCGAVTPPAVPHVVVVNPPWGARLMDGGGWVGDVGPARPWRLAGGRAGACNTIACLSRLGWAGPGLDLARGWLLPPEPVLQRTCAPLPSPPPPCLCNTTRPDAVQQQAAQPVTCLLLPPWLAVARPRPLPPLPTTNCLLTACSTTGLPAAEASGPSWAGRIPIPRGSRAAGASRHRSRTGATTCRGCRSRGAPWTPSSSTSAQVGGRRGAWRGVAWRWRWRGVAVARHAACGVRARLGGHARMGTGQTGEGRGTGAEWGGGSAAVHVRACVSGMGFEGRWATEVCEWGMGAYV